MIHTDRDVAGKDQTLETENQETRKLRLLLFEECHRGCPGCCNKDYDLEKLPVCGDYSPYGVIMLTGGEPMLHPEIVLKAVREIRQQSKAPVILYTALTRNKEALGAILDQIDGVTITLHDEDDIQPFQEFDAFYGKCRKEGKLLRLNIFEEVGDFHVSSEWNVKRNIRWIKDCPLPAGEVFMRYQSRRDR